MSELNLGRQGLDVQQCSRGNDKPAYRILKTLKRILDQNYSSAMRPFGAAPFWAN